jgi:tetratricopeptide (TPR) repeat protein
MKRLFFPILILLISLIAGYQILCMWRGTSLYQKDLSKENLLKAIQISPSNPDPFYRLGLFYQWDIRNIDLKESLKYFKKAIERDPLEQRYWLNLAKIFQRMGEGKLSEKALEKAILLFPAGYQGRWVAGNLFLQIGEFDKALQHFSYLLAYYPNQSHSIYDILAKAVNDSDFILEKLVPRNRTSLQQYLSHLYEAGDHESAQKAWQKRDSFAYKPDRAETLRHIEFLIYHAELNEAFLIWKERLKEEGLSISYDGNLVSNGGFEKEKLLGGGFDWKIDKVSGVEISFDPSMTFEGKRSLKIVFNGKENVDFYQVYQFVPLKPNTEYVLKANMKTKAITTKSGLKIEISGIGSALRRESDSLIGDNEWKELMIAFRNPAQSRGGLVRVRRNKTEKFDRFISGTVWIDNVSLAEKK